VLLPFCLLLQLFSHCLLLPVSAAGAAAAAHLHELVLLACAATVD
jgi:hypothetical protein